MQRSELALPIPLFREISPFPPPPESKPQTRVCNAGSKLSLLFKNHVTYRLMSLIAKINPINF